MSDLPHPHFKKSDKERMAGGDPAALQPDALSQQTLPSRLAYYHDPDFVWEKVDLELDIRRIKEDLFLFTDLLAAHVRDNPPSSILIEDTSARFIGRFAVGALGLAGRADCPVFFVRPPGLLDYSAAKLASFDRELEQNLPAIGAAPLVITEYIANGIHAAHLTTLLAMQASHCTYSTLYLLDCSAGAAHIAMQAKLTELGAHALIAAMLVNDPELAAPVYRNQALNSVCARGPYCLPECQAVSPTHPYLYEWRSTFTTPEEKRTREILKKHSEQRLLELISEYRTRGTRPDSPPRESLI
jgi:hypothetical protein